MGGSSSNSSAIDEQKKAAAEARYNDDLRSWRLEKGTNEINNLFDGTALPSLRDMPTYAIGSKDYIPTSFASSDLTKYFTGGQTTMPSTYRGDTIQLKGHFRGGNSGEYVFPVVPEGYKRTGNDTYKWVGGGGTPATPGTYDLNQMLKDGFINQATFDQYNVNGNGLVYDTDTARIDQLKQTVQNNAGKGAYGVSGNTTPWVDNLADTYLKAYNDYYMPQLDKQYEDANKNLTYDLARAGLLRSSAAADTQSDLARQNAENTAMVKSQGDQGVAALKQKINSAKQDAINQLYATENPDVAANQAMSSIRTIQNTQPDYSPLGDMFKSAIVGMSGYQSGAADRNYYNTITGGNKSAATTIN